MRNEPAPLLNAIFVVDSRPDDARNKTVIAPTRNFLRIISRTDMPVSALHPARKVEPRPPVFV